VPHTAIKTIKSLEAAKYDMLMTQDQGSN